MPRSIRSQARRLAQASSRAVHRHRGELTAVRPFVYGSIGIACALFFFLGIPIVFRNQSLFYARWIDETLSTWAGLPIAHIVHEALRHGEFPLWNPYNGLGAPFAAEIKTALYSPFQWLLFLSPTTGVFELTILLRMFALGSFTLLFLMGLGVRPWIGFAIALLYSFSGNILLLANGWHMNTLALSPLLLLGVHHLLQRRTRRGVTIISISWCLIIAGAGLIDAMLTGILAAITVSMGILLGAQATTRPRPAHYSAQIPQRSTASTPSNTIICSTARRLRGTVTLGLPFASACLLGFGLIGLYLLPLLEARSLALPPYAGRSGAIFDSWSYFLSMFFHKLTVTPENPSHFFMKHRQYFSILALFGCCLSLISFRTCNRQEKTWILSLGLFLLVYFGKLYGLSWLQWIDRTPLLRDIRFEKYLGVPGLSLHALAAIGLEHFSREGRKGLHIPGTITAIGVAALPLWYVWCVLEEPPEHGLLHALRYATIVLAVYLLLCIARRSPNRFVPFAAILLTVFTVDADFPDGFFREPRKIVHPAAAQAWLRKDVQNTHLRVFDTTRVPKRAALYGVHDIQDYSDSFDRRYIEIFREHALTGKVLNPFSIIATGRYDSLRHELLSYLSVGYFVVKRKQTPVSTHVPSPFRIVFINPSAHPRAHLVNEVEVLAPEAIRKRILSDPSIALEKALVESPVSKPSTLRGLVGERGLASPAGRVEIEAFRMNEIRLDVMARDPGMVIVNDLYYPGWRAWVGRREVPIHRTNYLFRGISVPRGYSFVRLEYRPRSLFLGAIISATSVTALVATLLFLNRSD